MMNFNARIPASAFGLPSDQYVLGFCPAELPKGTRFATPDFDYSFQPEALERFRMWWESANTAEPLFISGPAGAGKTSFVMQFLRRVNAPVVSITCRRRMDKYELIGQWAADETGKLVWQDGPATIAWRTGAVLVINEPTSAPADMWVSANDLLEGDDLVIDRTGEVVKRHPNTRVVFTDNRPLGDASETEQYLGRNAQDLSVLDRCWQMILNFPEKKFENDLLWKKVSAHAAGLDSKRAHDIVAKVVDFAESLRIARRDDPEMKSITPMSHRGMIRFIEMLFTFAKAPAIKGVNPVSTALGLTLTDGLAEAAATSIQHSCQFDFSELTALVEGR